MNSKRELDKMELLQVKGMKHGILDPGYILQYPRLD